MNKTTTRRSAASKAVQPDILASTLEEERSAVTTGKTIAIAVALPHGIRFDDIPSKTGGFKSISLPGINDNLRGKRTGVLALPGNALCIQLAVEDWEALVRVHGREIAFTGRNGRMPCIYPVGDVKGFKAASNEIKEMRTGLEAASPDSVNVKEDK